MLKYILQRFMRGAPSQEPFIIISLLLGQWPLELKIEVDPPDVQHVRKQLLSVQSGVFYGSVL